MDAFEKYYRRSYNAINKLIDAYKEGYNPENTSKFRNELRNQYLSNSTIIQTEINDILFTLTTALLGLNKEAIEKTEKIIKYEKNNHELDISKINYNEESKLRLKNFYDSKVISTDFDNWLSIKINPNGDTENIKYLKRIRNSLMHSNFYVDNDNPLMPFTKLKTKSYYEADLFNTEFQLFVLEYFGNIDAMGLSEAMYTFIVNQRQITDKMDLIIYLKTIVINEISYKNLKSVGIKSPELFLSDSLDEYGRVNTNKFIAKLRKSTNVDDLKIFFKDVKGELLLNTFNYIEKNYGDKFYEMDYLTQSGIISTHLKYCLNPKMEISNWFNHFIYLYLSINNNEFNESFFNGDDFGTESCYPALMILKSYLIMYRLQNDNFDELDYSKIDFDILDLDIKIRSENVDKSPVTNNYFRQSFDKEKNKGILTNDTLIWNKIICDVVRDSLAHGNIRTYTNNNNVPMIELTDIDSKKGTARILELPISKYENFLNSEAFLPRNCYKKEEEKVLVKK